MTQQSVVLYSYFRSSASYRVRIALALKAVSYEYRAVNLLTGNRDPASALSNDDGDAQPGEQYSRVFRSTLNPKNEVPVLQIDGVLLTQSLPIMEYLEETRVQQGVPLLPGDSVARANARRIAELINSGIQPLQNLTVLKALPEAEREAWAARWIRRGFVAVEAILAVTAGRYCVGDEVSIADICLVPQVMNAQRFQVDMTPYPTIQRVNDLLVQLEAFKVAHPMVQPDAPKA